jgi:hypothetical protein
MVKICQDLQMIADSARLFCLFCQDLPSRAVFSSPSWSADVILHGDHRAANSWGWRTRSGFNQEKGFKASKDGDWKLQTDWTIEKKSRNIYGPVRMAPKLKPWPWAQLVEPGFGKDSKSRLRLLMKHILMLDCCCHSSFLKQMCFF